MPVTELLITGYNCDESAFAVNLVPSAATVVLTHTDEEGETVVDSAWQQATDAFTAVHDALDRLVCAPAAASS